MIIIQHCFTHTHILSLSNAHANTHTLSLSHTHTRSLSLTHAHTEAKKSLFMHTDKEWILQDLSRQYWKRVIIFDKSKRESPWEPMLIYYICKIKLQTSSFLIIFFHSLIIERAQESNRKINWINFILFFYFFDWVNFAMLIISGNNKELSQESIKTNYFVCVF